MIRCCPPRGLPRFSVCVFFYLYRGAFVRSSVKESTISNYFMCEWTGNGADMCEKRVTVCVCLGLLCLKTCVVVSIYVWPVNAMATATVSDDF